MEHGLFGWLIIVVALVFIFGGKKKIEDLGSGFGGFMREFNKARNEGAAAVAKTTDPAPKAKAPKKAAKKAKKKPARKA